MPKYVSIKSDLWKVIQEEVEVLRKNHSFDFINFPKGKRSLKNKCVFKLKHEEKFTIKVQG